ncbi:hypothetical protein NFI96_000340 [Prochilodus magdalenae]|nr:hypothetical protein NFI96_000340 [Prochilodus magdalenae]
MEDTTAHWMSAIVAVGNYEKRFEVKRSILKKCRELLTVVIRKLQAAVNMAPKKAKKKESASSNVFTMFEQSQIQEFKEARTISTAYSHLSATAI